MGTTRLAGYQGCTRHWKHGIVAPGPSSAVARPKGCWPVVHAAEWVLRDGRGSVVGPVCAVQAGGRPQWARHRRFDTLRRSMTAEGVEVMAACRTGVAAQGAGDRR
jgi:hypothetical protein